MDDAISLSFVLGLINYGWYFFLGLMGIIWTFVSAVLLAFLAHLIGGAGYDFFKENSRYLAEKIIYMAAYKILHPEARWANHSNPQKEMYDRWFVDIVDGPWLAVTKPFRALSTLRAAWQLNLDYLPDAGLTDLPSVFYVSIVAVRTWKVLRGAVFVGTAIIFAEVLFFLGLRYLASTTEIPLKPYPQSISTSFSDGNPASEFWGVWPNNNGTVDHSVGRPAFRSELPVTGDPLFRGYSLNRSPYSYNGSGGRTGVFDATVGNRVFVPPGDFLNRSPYSYNGSGGRTDVFDTTVGNRVFVPPGDFLNRSPYSYNGSGGRTDVFDTTVVNRVFVPPGSWSSYDTIGRLTGISDATVVNRVFVDTTIVNSFSVTSSPGDMLIYMTSLSADGKTSNVNVFLDVSSGISTGTIIGDNTLSRADGIPPASISSSVSVTFSAADELWKVYVIGATLMILTYFVGVIAIRISNREWKSQILTYWKACRLFLEECRDVLGGDIFVMNGTLGKIIW